MKILIVSATHFEVKPLLGFLGIALPTLGINNANMDFEDKEIQVLITGIGMVNTALYLGRYLDSTFDLVLNVGVCGAFDKLLKPGDVVRISKDTLSELGAEDGDFFLTYDKLNLPGEYIFSEHSSYSHSLLDSLKAVEGITVNTVHGNENSIERVHALFCPSVESMEGAAFFASCKGVVKNYLQVRAVSNYVETRDKSKWQMELAIKNLNSFVIDLINNSSSSFA